MRWQTFKGYTIYVQSLKLVLREYLNAREREGYLYTQREWSEGCDGKYTITYIYIWKRWEYDTKETIHNLWRKVLAWNVNERHEILDLSQTFYRLYWYEEIIIMCFTFVSFFIYTAGLHMCRTVWIYFFLLDNRLTVFKKNIDK